jgi:hypothetical protein
MKSYLWWKLSTFGKCISPSVQVMFARHLVSSHPSADDNTIVNKRVSEAAAGDTQHNNNNEHKLDTNINHENAVCFGAHDFHDEFGKAQEK